MKILSKTSFYEKLLKYHFDHVTIFCYPKYISWSLSLDILWASWMFLSLVTYFLLDVLQHSSPGTWPLPLSFQDFWDSCYLIIGVFKEVEKERETHLGMESGAYDGIETIYFNQS